MRLYIVTKANYQNYGLGTERAEAFTSRKKATEWMRLNLCRMLVNDRLLNDDETELLDEIKSTNKEISSRSGNIQVHDDYAYISDLYYYDIFEQELEINL